MLRNATQFLDRHAHARGIAISLGASLLLGVAPLSYAIRRIAAHSPDAAPLDTASGYTPDAAYAMIARYGDDARSYYVFNALTVDVVAPALFLLTTSLLATASLRRLTAPDSRLRALVVVLALAAWLADVTENLLLSRVVLAYPERVDDLVNLADLATRGKRLLVFTHFGLVLCAALALAAYTLARRRRA